MLEQRNPYSIPALLESRVMGSPMPMSAGVRSAGGGAMALVALLLGGVVLLGTTEALARTVRVGVYTNPPKVELGHDGRPQGIFIDVIEHIAEREGWLLEYHPGSWDDCLRRIRTGEIDLMPDVARSPTRRDRLLFNQIPVLTSWLQVFTLEGHVLTAINALEGKTVAVLEGSLQQEVLDDLRDNLGLSIGIRAYDDYPGTIEAVERREADAVLADRFFNYVRDDRSDLVATPIILDPSDLYFAVPIDGDPQLLTRIDIHLARMMNDPDSEYYASLSLWLGETPRVLMPRIIKWLIAPAAAILLLVGVWNVLLGWRVRTRTRELSDANAELQDALEQLEAARAEAVERERLYAFGQLAGGVAHDLNNLLVPILSYSDLLMDREHPGDTEDREQMLRTIKSAAQHGSELIKRMQQFHRATRQPEPKQVVDLNEIVREVVDLTRPRLEGRGAGRERAVEVALALGDNAQIHGRPYELHEMIMNLVLNAVDAMPTGGRLEISTARRDESVALTVRDTGRGMSPEVLAQCFRPFFSTKGDQGTGIGLTMVKNIVTEHDGAIDVQSRPGAGTDIHLTFRTNA